MRKLALMVLMITTVISVEAQKRFEFDVTTKLGYYMPVNPTSRQNTYFPENAFSPAIGASLGYTFFKSTGVFIGMEYCYLSPKVKSVIEGYLEPAWQSVNIPFNIQQGIGKKFFLTGGVTLSKQLNIEEFVSAFDSQKTPEYNWQLGAGYKIKDLRISLQYCRGFNEINKLIKNGENSTQGETLKHQEIFVKLEYPLWRF